MDSLSATIIIVIFFLLTEAFFSGSEYLLVSFPKIRLRRLADEGKIWAAKLEYLLKTPETLFGVTSVGTNISVIATTTLATAYISMLGLGIDSDLISIMIMGPVTLILGEIVPKIIFREKSDLLAKYLAKPLEISIKIFNPLLKVTSFLARGFTLLFRLENQTGSASVTREELVTLTKMSHSKLDLAEDERKMIDRIFKFSSSTVLETMRPLVSVAGLSINSTIAQARLKVVESGFSRLPIYQDRIFNIVGIITAFDILKERDSDENLDTIMYSPLYVPSSKRNATLLKEMTLKQEHMAVVVNEYGATEGIVTLEDLVEEIVGEIGDEYDKDFKQYEKIADGRWIVDAMIEVDIINDELGLSITPGDYETLSGLVNFALERIPDRKQTFAFGRYIFKVLEASSSRAVSVEIEDVLVSDSADNQLPK
ncbi:MAG: hemolysin family protein [Nitrospinota bacterium]